MNPFSVHTAALAAYEATIGGGNEMGLATLTFPTLENITVPCTHTQIVNDFNLIAGGQSLATMIEQVEFRVATMNGKIPKKAIFCDLKITPDSPAVNYRLGHGGLMAGGEVYRFMLVDKFFHV